MLVGVEPAKEQMETILLHTVACSTDIEQHTAIGTEELFDDGKDGVAEFAVVRGWLSIERRNREILD